MKKKVGIVCDDYKLDKYKEELLHEGFDNFSISPFTHSTSSIQIITTENRIEDIYRICVKLELQFKRSN